MVGQFWPKYKWKTIFCTKRCRCQIPVTGQQYNQLIVGEKKTAKIAAFMNFNYCSAAVNIYYMILLASEF